MEESEREQTKLKNDEIIQQRLENVERDKERARERARMNQKSYILDYENENNCHSHQKFTDTDVFFKKLVEGSIEREQREREKEQIFMNQYIDCLI